MRAVVEQHAQLDEVPKLKILIVKGQEDLTIKVTTVQPSDNKLQGDHWPVSQTLS